MSRFKRYTYTVCFIFSNLFTSTMDTGISVAKRFTFVHFILYLVSSLFTARLTACWVVGAVSIVRVIRGIKIVEGTGTIVFIGIKPEFRSRLGLLVIA